MKAIGDVYGTRLMSRVEMVPESGCWIWMGATHDGYGMMRVNGKLEKTHRVAYRLFSGEIPDALHVCHRCDVRSCVNPAHLFVGTRSDNMRDSVRKKRNNNVSKTHCIQGHHFSDANVLLRHYGDGRVARRCRECLRQGTQEWRKSVAHHDASEPR